MQTSNTTSKHFLDHGYIVVSYPPTLRRAVERAVEAWKEFVALPTDVKKGLPYSNGGAGVGYEFKDGKGPMADRKENFDVTLSGSKWLERNADVINNKVALKFVQDATALIGVLKPVIVEFAERIERELGLPGFADEVRMSDGAYFTRFIHYFPDRVVGEEIATAHTDQSGFTFHLYESDPGLQCLTYGASFFGKSFPGKWAKGWGRKWIDMPVSEGKTVVIPSMQMQLTPPFRALCHRVVATEATAVHGRTSVVCFIQLTKTPKYDKDRCGRLQEKWPGFNYDMPHDEFVKMFR